MNKSQPSMEVVRSYCEKFFGYGQWEAPYWFVGMEEGGKDSADRETVFQRINLWNERRRRELEHGPAIYGAFSYSQKWLQPNPPLQSTWKQLIRIYLALKGVECTEATMRKCQSKGWGIETGDVCLAEMFALPSASVDNWVYHSHFGHSFLQNRMVYRHEFYSKRATTLRRRIIGGKPSVVVFYGFSYREYYEGILGRNFVYRENKKLWVCDFNGTQCFLIYHPVWGSDEYFSSAANLIIKSQSNGLL